MNASDAADAAVIKSDTTSRTRLHGRWLWIARALWIFVALLAVGMYVVAVPITFTALETLCQPDSCPQSGIGLTPEEASGLQQLGISVKFYAWYFTFMIVSVAVLYFCLGALIFWRRSDDWMALFLALMLVTMGAVFSPAIDPLVVQQPFLRWLLALIQTLGFGSLASFMFLFPNGRFVPRWTGWLALATWLIVAAFAVSASIFTIFGQFIPIFLIALAASVAAQTYRYRRSSTPTERQQTKWVLAGFTVFLVLTAIGFLPWLIEPSITQPGVAGKLYSMVRVPLFANLPVTFIPVAITFSLLRYRLWDVDFVINRSLVYGVMTLLLSGMLVGGFFGLRALWDVALGGDQPVVAAVLPAIFVALIFNPTRSWLRKWVDRRIYGINVDYQRADTPTLSPVAASHTLRTNTGVYDTLQPIARGGMAEIYRADDPTRKKPVAVKILPAALAKEADFRKRFEREARLVAGLRHPNIVQMYEFGESEGTHFMIMEFIAGDDLGEVIQNSAPLPIERVRRILEETASALDYAHGQGLVHRDIKPSNVMLEPVPGKGERAVLMDFGIARIIGGQTRLTATGLMGTFDYMSPEQINDSRDVDARADVYALGVMAYQMLTGQLPFKAGNTGALLMAHLRQPPPDPRDIVPGLSEEVCAAVVRAMDKKPENRFQRAGEFGAALA